MKGKGGCYKKGGAVSSGSSFAEMKPKGEKGPRPKRIHGVSPKQRLDKKARGGKIATPSSPLTGAAPKGISGQNTGANK